jgi:hypothetical protein
MKRRKQTAKRKTKSHLYLYARYDMRNYQINTIQISVLQKSIDV